MPSSCLLSIPKTELRSRAFVLRKPLHLMKSKSCGKAISLYLKHDALGIVCAILSIRSSSSGIAVQAQCCPSAFAITAPSKVKDKVGVNMTQLRC